MDVASVLSSTKTTTTAATTNQILQTKNQLEPNFTRDMNRCPECESNLVHDPP